ncbi:hypothetical protein HYV71_04155 [Candidatus Uhrbacteria bacterium]|nr:hypothetical protein [Candidatus Uhrbacteria bacterium]
MPDQNFIKQDAADATSDQAKAILEKEKKSQKRKNIFRKKELGVNLMSSDVMREISSQVERKNLFQVLTSFFVALGLVGIGYLVILIYDATQADDRSNLDARLTALNAEIANLEKNTSTLTAFQDKLGTIRSLLEQHVYWTQFLTELEKATLQAVEYDSISVSSGSNVLTLGALTDTYETIGKQIRAFQNASSTFPEVTVRSANALLDQAGDIAGVTFSMSLTYNGEILTQIGNATSTQK